MPSLRDLPLGLRLPARLGLLAALSLGALSLACGNVSQASPADRDPLASLASSEPSLVFDLAFWVQQQATSSPLWRRAFAYCRSRPRSPNCRTVRMASWWTTPPAATLHTTAQPSGSASTAATSERTRP